MIHALRKVERPERPERPLFPVPPFPVPKPLLWRWKAVVLMGIFGWVSIVASYGIFWQFPWPFIRDDLLCTILEWCVGGAAIAGIVTRKAKETQ